MDSYRIKEIDKLCQQMMERLDGLIAALGQKPTVALSQYVPDVEAAYLRLKGGLGRSPDVLLRKLQVPACPQGPVLIVFVDGLVDSQMVDQDIIAPLLKTTDEPSTWDQTTLGPGKISKETGWDAILTDLTGGSTLVMAPGLPYVWVADTSKYKQRGIERPQTESSIRGQQEAFNEVILTQMNQIRQRIRDPQLQFHKVTLGTRQRNPVALAYIEDLANPSLVKTVTDRVSAIKVDGFVSSSEIAGLIRDFPKSIFPTIRSTERVDVAVRHILEGGVVILVNGDPFVLNTPAPLVDFYRTAMGYSAPWYDTSFTRLIRVVGWALGVYLPALYIALTGLNSNLLPSILLTTTLGSHTGYPFAPLTEALIMIFIVETLREAALRLPKQLATTLGTIGAIVIGTAVVKAGLVSNQVIVIITLTALTFFSVPVYELTGTWRVVNFGMLLAAAFFGFMGIIIGTILLVARLVELESFGVPYLTPMTPFRWADWRALVARVPWSALRTRPSISRPLDVETRQAQSPSSEIHLMHTRRSS